MRPREGFIYSVCPFIFDTINHSNICLSDLPGCRRKIIYASGHAESPWKPNYLPFGCRCYVSKHHSDQPTSGRFSCLNNFYDCRFMYVKLKLIVHSHWLGQRTIQRWHRTPMVLTVYNLSKEWVSNPVHHWHPLLPTRCVVLVFN